MTSLIENGINLLGLTLNLAGTLVAAFAADGYMNSVHQALTIHEHTLKDVLDPKADVLVVEGMDKVRERKMSSGAKRLRMGLGMVALGFVLSAIPYSLEVLDALSKWK